MKKAISFTFALMLLFSGISSANPPRKIIHSFVSHYENVLGTSMQLKIFALNEKQAAIAETAAVAEIERLSKILSGYDSNSEFSKWLATSNQPITISKELFEVLFLFDQWREKTNGALDASAEIIGKVWKQAADINQLPAQQDLLSAVDQVKQIHWKLDASTLTATHLSNVPLKLNSFAKSYIIKSAAEAAMAVAKVSGIIVNIGGDMVIAGDIHETVNISNPKADAENDAPIDQLVINNKAVATSGNYRRGELINGNWYSHIVDPRTGQPADEIISATVVAASATDAGALATAFNVMKPSESIALAATMPGVEYLIITKNGDRIESKEWKSMEVSLPSEEIYKSNSIDKKAAEKEWKNELLISLELAQQQGFAKRPFAAIWVEDNNHASVKTIALWYNKPRWLRDLREWYRGNGNSYNADAASFNTITSATRSPGKYTLKWDGKDDKGNTLKPGTYTVYIEVVREHGGYDLLHQEIECNDKTQQFNLKGNAEIETATLDYRKK